MNKFILIITIFLFSCFHARAQEFCFVELNCENLFDTQHDSLKNDIDFTPEGSHRWTKNRYYRKLNSIGREIISCGGVGEKWHLPDLVALEEVENETVLNDLILHSLLRRSGYKFVMTNSLDVRGIDVALLYNPQTFSLLHHNSIRIKPMEGQRPTRDILYVKGLSHISSPDTFHIFVVHAPSRSGGKKHTEKYRLNVSSKLCHAIDSVFAFDEKARIIVAGDFNDYYTDLSVKALEQHNMCNISANAQGKNGAKGTYRFRGEWGSLDQILVSQHLKESFLNFECYIHDADFLLEDETKYGGKRPHRNYLGPKYDPNGFSDHLPLVFKGQLQSTKTQ